MDLSSYFRLALSSGNALLPGTTATWLSMHLGWAIVLGAVTLRLASRMPTRGRWALAGLVLLWTLLPGAASPAFWLGLAFQSPSLMSVMLCLGWLAQGPRHERDAPARMGLMVLGALLGWVLLLDTLAWFPVSVYAWGFGSVPLALVLLMAALLWLRWGPGSPLQLLLVLALFVVTRAPSGNLWDALLDPLLWLALQWGCLVRVARLYRGSGRSLPATRV